MKIYHLYPEFSSCWMYEDFFKKVGGEYWIDLQKPMSNLEEALKDKSFLRMIFFYCLIWS